jgi:hypothetical protein
MIHIMCKLLKTIIFSSASFEDDKHTTTRMATTSSHSLTNTHFGQSSDPLQHISASSSNQHKKLMSLNSSSSVVNAHGEISRYFSFLLYLF